MTDQHSPVTEDELHALVDGELPAERRAAVEAWLANHPDEAALVASWRAQAEMIRARYAPIGNETVPSRLNVDTLTRGRRRWTSIAAAAAIMAFLVGGIAGWMARGASAAAPDSFETFIEDAFSAHKLYINEVRHPIEVRANEDHLLPWLSRRVGTTLRAPDLGGFGLSLLGGRLLPSVNGPAALFMYENGGGERFTLYCSKLKAPRSALRYTGGDNVAAVHWVEGDYGYALVGPAEKLKLKSMARAAYEQMENRMPGSRSSADPPVARHGG